MLDRTAPTYVLGRGENDDTAVRVADGVTAGAESVLPEVGNIPAVLRSATTCLDVASSVTGRYVSLPIAVAVISIEGESRVRPAAFLSSADTFSAKVGVPGAAIRLPSHFTFWTDA